MPRFVVVLAAAVFLAMSFSTDEVVGQLCSAGPQCQGKGKAQIFLEISCEEIDEAVLALYTLAVCTSATDQAVAAADSNCFILCACDGTYLVSVSIAQVGSECVITCAAEIGYETPAFCDAEQPQS